MTIISEQSKLISVCKESGVLLSVRKTFMPATRIANQGDYEHVGEVQ
jgi:hypothetical protein